MRGGKKVADGTFEIIVSFSAVFGAIAIAGFLFQEEDIHKFILAQGGALTGIVILAAVGTDLAEALILPTVVVMIAETLAFSEILTEKEKLNAGITDSPKIGRRVKLNIMETSPILVSGGLVIYGALLTGFQGGAVIGAGSLYYLINKERGDVSGGLWDTIHSLAGIGLGGWLIGFAILFLFPRFWLLGLFLSSAGILIKVISHMQLLGVELKRALREKIIGEK